MDTTTTTLSLSLQDAQVQLAEKSDRVQQIRAKLAEMRTIAMGSTRAHARNEAALAEAVLAGADIGAVLESMPAADQGITPAPISPSEARRLVSGLEALLADALDYENQARSAVRRASVQELKDLLAQEKAAYDRDAGLLQLRWARVTVLASHLAGVVGIEQMPFTWNQLRLPRAVPPKNLAPFTSGDYLGGAEEIMKGTLGNRARAEVAELLKTHGIG